MVAIYTVSDLFPTWRSDLQLVIAEVGAETRQDVAMARTPREQTKRQVLETGVRLLMERGLEGGCANVGMSDVLSVIEADTGRRITNASIYGRIWATQAEFHKDLLLAAAEQFPSGEELALSAAADAVLGQADLSTPESRAAALQAVCRVAGEAHLRALAASRSWQTWLAIWAITVSTPTLDDDVERGPSIAARHAVAVDALSGVLDAVLAKVNASMRSGTSSRQLAMAVYALSEGLVLHDRFATDDDAAVERSGEVWTLFSVALAGILTGFVELR
jgi:hypothetical protein